jgi:hypothetical protein
MSEHLLAHSRSGNPRYGIISKSDPLLLNVYSGLPTGSMM